LRSGRAISTRRNATVPPAGEKPGLDIHSLNLNYELMLRLEDKTIAVVARGIFERLLKHPAPPMAEVTDLLAALAKSLGAFFLLTRIAPLSSCASITR